MDFFVGTFELPFADLNNRQFEDSNSHKSFENCSVDYHTDNVNNLFFHLPQTNLASSKENHVILGDIRIYNASDLAKKFKIHYINNHQLVLELFVAYGTEIFPLLDGEFSFVLYNQNTKELIAVRDPLGQRPFFYSIYKGLFICSSHFQKVHELLPLKPTINERWLYFYCWNRYENRETTIFNEINRLTPGKYLTCGDGNVKEETFWQLSKVPKKSENDIQKAIFNVKERMHQAIEKRIRNEKNIGVELSGGLDSSLIASMLQEKSKKSEYNLTAYTNKFSEEEYERYPDYYDEWPKAEKVAKHASIKHEAVDKSVFTQLGYIENMLNVHGYPSWFDFSIYQNSLYKKLTEYGSKSIFSGFGGDELLSASATNIYLNTLVKSLKFYSLFNVFLKTRKHTLKQSIYLTARYLYLFYRNNDRNKRKQMFQQRWKYWMLKDSFNEKHDLENVLFDNLYFPDNQSINERENFNLQNGAMVERLETCYSISNTYGLTYNYPLLDIPLVEYYYSLPDEIKGNHALNRFIFRNICMDYLPNEITMQEKPSNTMTMPFVKVQMIEQFDELINYVKNIPVQNTIFKYFDRDKILQSIENHFFENTDSKSYKTLYAIIQLNMFFEKHQL